MSKKKEKEKVYNLPIKISHPFAGITSWTHPSAIIKSEKMDELLKELRYHVYKSAEVLVKIHRQGVADGLSEKQIRGLINLSLRGILSDRQIRRLVPKELKQLQYHPEHNKDERVKKVAKMSAFSDSDPDSDSEWGPRKTHNYFAEKYYDMKNAFSAKVEAYDREQGRKLKEAYEREPITPLELEGVEGEPHKERKPTPEAIYKDFMNSIKKCWTTLYDYSDMPGPDLDMETKILQPSEKYRLRLLKGLPDLERKVLLSQISQFCFAGVGFLKYAKLVQSQEPRVSPGWDCIRKNEHPDDDDEKEDSDSAEG